MIMSSAYVLGWTDRDTVEKTFEAIGDAKLDAFVKTFIGKADKQKMWDKCRGVFDHDNNLLGICITTITKRDPKSANLQLMHTFSKYRRKGIGRLLLEDSMDLANMENCEYFRVSAEITAVGFYASCGIPFLGIQKSGTYLSLFRLNGTRDAINYHIHDKALNKNGKIWLPNCETPSKKHAAVNQSLGDKYIFEKLMSWSSSMSG
jgi:GNAT superfamily N-acetyltransferase